MNKLLVLLIVFVAADLTPQQAAKQFLENLRKNVVNKNRDIFDIDFSIIVKNQSVGREPSIKAIFETVISSTWPSYTPSFKNDGILQIMFDVVRGDQQSYILAKPYSDIEGGFKFYRFVIL